MTRWERVYDTQLDLFRYWDSVEGKAYGRGYVNSVLSKGNRLAEHIVTHTPEALDPELRAENARGNAQEVMAFTEGNPDRLGELERLKLFAADPIYVSSEMMELIKVASPEFVPEPFQPTDLMTTAGFMLLPEPLIMLDANGKKSSFRIISWYPMIKRRGERPPNEEIEIEWDRSRESHGVFMSFYTAREDLLDPEIDDYADQFLGTDMRPMEEWLLLHATTWVFNQSVESVFDISQSWWQAVQALFRISMQYISVREKMFPPRATRRRAKREGFPEKNVTVITLRRPRGKRSEEPGTVEWSHRWIVGGHWRNQWYPSLKMHRQIWVAPYVKGPEHLELHIRTLRAFNVVR